MSTEDLFDVVFEGRPLPGFPKEKAVDALAKLSKRSRDKAAPYFNGQNKVLKKGLPKEEALRYQKALNNAGLACHIAEAGVSQESAVTSKSAREVSNPSQSQSSDIKYEIDEEDSTNYIKKKQKSKLEKSVMPWSEYWKGAVIVSLIFMTLLFLGEGAGRISPMSLGLMFTAIFLACYPFTLLVIRLTGGSIYWLIVATFATGGAPILFGMFYGIVHGLTRLLRIDRFFKIYLPASAVIMLAGMALAPHSVFAVNNNSTGNNSKSNEAITHNSENPPDISISKNNLRRFTLAAQMYFAENGNPEPLTPALFEKVVKQYMQSSFSDEVMEGLRNGAVKLEGDLTDYRIGFHENGSWTILDEHGSVTTENRF